MKREIWLSLGVMGSCLLLFVLICGFAIFDEVRVATTYREVQAVVVPGDNPSAGNYRYQYRVGDRLCTGNSDLSYDPGPRIKVRYKPDDVCVSDASDGGAVIANGAIALLWLAPWLGVAAIAVVKPFRGAGQSSKEEAKP